MRATHDRLFELVETYFSTEHSHATDDTSEVNIQASLLSRRGINPTSLIIRWEVTS